MMKLSNEIIDRGMDAWEQGTEASPSVPPVVIARPGTQTVPLVVASPHSGYRYDADFLASSRLDPRALRKSEDCHVHDLLAAAPDLGAPLLRATFPRAFLDVNREPYELDPHMFDGPLPAYANTLSPRVIAGLGTIAKVVATGAEIYDRRLPVSEIERRIEGFYQPYHAALETLIEETRQRFGWCLLLDGHSMPSAPSGPMGRLNSAARAAPADFVLGDSHGTACAPAVIDAAHRVLADLGYRVVRNSPYAGGFTTRHYGIPRHGVHALQIEISRSLYMDEVTYARSATFANVAATMTQVMTALAAVRL